MAHALSPTATIQTTVVETSHNEIQSPHCKKSTAVYTRILTARNRAVSGPSEVTVRILSLPPGVSVQVDGRAISNWWHGRPRIILKIFEIKPITRQPPFVYDDGRLISFQAISWSLVIAKYIPISLGRLRSTSERALLSKGDRWCCRGKEQSAPGIKSLK